MLGSMHNIEEKKKAIIPAGIDASILSSLFAMCCSMKCIAYINHISKFENRYKVSSVIATTLKIYNFFTFYPLQYVSALSCVKGLNCKI